MNRKQFSEVVHKEQGFVPKLIIFDLSDSSIVFFSLKRFGGGNPELLKAMVDGGHLGKIITQHAAS